MDEQLWRVDLTCCGRDDGHFFTATWQEADDFREAYCTGPACSPHGYSSDPVHYGHMRSGVIRRAATADPPPARISTRHQTGGRGHTERNTDV